jgi:histone-lysine N-methyltransferase SETMAR
MGTSLLIQIKRCFNEIETSQLTFCSIKKFKVTLSAGKVMLAEFWDSQGVLLVHFQKRGENVNSTSYCEVLLTLRVAVHRKRPGQLARGALLHHDNARPHTARATQERIPQLKWEPLEHPPYSPDLAPSYFLTFGPLKIHLGGKYFVDDEEVETKVRKWLRQQSKDFNVAGFDTLVKRWGKHIKVGGGCVKK